MGWCTLFAVFCAVDVNFNQCLGAAHSIAGQNMVLVRNKKMELCLYSALLNSIRGPILPSMIRYVPIRPAISSLSTEPVFAQLISKFSF